MLGFLRRIPEMLGLKGKAAKPSPRRAGDDDDDETPATTRKPARSGGKRAPAGKAGNRTKPGGPKSGARK
jgi:hypothetical protein